MYRLRRSRSKIWFPTLRVGSQISQAVHDFSAHALTISPIFLNWLNTYLTHMHARGIVLSSLGDNAGIHFVSKSGFRPQNRNPNTDPEPQNHPTHPHTPPHTPTHPHTTPHIPTYTHIYSHIPTYTHIYPHPYILYINTYRIWGSGPRGLRVCICIYIDNDMCMWVCMGMYGYV
jgi:hypothetical protein